MRYFYVLNAFGNKLLLLLTVLNSKVDALPNVIIMNSYLPTKLGQGSYFVLTFVVRLVAKPLNVMQLLTVSVNYF